ncbi:hypothetical protein BCR44DRAFT_40695 [Catenaria anguillulae PL171]|uniref:Uncharacterized protein n=1 Tax=Catenaria anguillulae PL171 TaxID=765915 RepID=A0A1Y2H6Q3_9FUNG|nr:hypothetical protein BCR44DRAFT_40695 [Catenaria anguillulae PL171]
MPTSVKSRAGGMYTRASLSITGRVNLWTTPSVANHAAVLAKLLSASVSMWIRADLNLPVCTNLRGNTSVGPDVASANLRGNTSFRDLDVAGAKGRGDSSV